MTGEHGATSGGNGKIRGGNGVFFGGNPIPPEVRGIPPRSGGVFPRGGAVIPGGSGIIPRSDGIIPWGSVIIPRNSGKISGNGGVIPTNHGTIPGNGAIIGLAVGSLARLNAARRLPTRLWASAINRGWEPEALSNPLLPKRSRGWRRGRRVHRENCRLTRPLSALWGMRNRRSKGRLDAGVASDSLPSDAPSTTSTTRLRRAFEFGVARGRGECFWGERALGGEFKKVFISP